MRVTGIRVILALVILARVILALAILSSLPLLLGGVAVADVRGPGWRYMWQIHNG